jgi:excisionase family DNA binding protein
MKRQRRTEAFMTLPELAQYLRLTTHALYKMAEQGRIPALKAGGQWRFVKGDVDAWMRTSAERARVAKRRRGGRKRR